MARTSRPEGRGGRRPRASPCLAPRTRSRAAAALSCPTRQEFQEEEEAAVLSSPGAVALQPSFAPGPLLPALRGFSDTGHACGPLPLRCPRCPGPREQNPTSFLPPFSPGNPRKTTSSVLKTHLGAQKLEWAYGARSEPGGTDRHPGQIPPQVAST